MPDVPPVVCGLQAHERTAAWWAAGKPVTRHLKTEHRMGSNYLWHRKSDATDPILVAAGYNIRRLIR
jgi:hypothetical protein